jgi:SAM-dependent methyltransferase
MRRMWALEVGSEAEEEDEEQEDEEEHVELLDRRPRDTTTPRGSSSSSSSGDVKRPHRQSNPCVNHQWKLGIAVLLCMMGVLYVSQRRKKSAGMMGQEQESRGNYHKTLPQSPYDGILRFQCPSAQKVAENIATAAAEHETWYGDVSKKLEFTEYLKSFRDTEFDNWGHSYEEVKDGMHSWKSRSFADLKSGDRIYESACGIGMNLYMTLEILQQASDVHNVTVYGNEHLPESADIARLIAGGSGKHPSSFLPAGGRLGTICAADSLHLDFVPSNSFDLVYTGYISPLFNPLHLNQSTTVNFEQYNAYCEGDAQLAAAAQQRQNDWYAAWVGEMIRIAKPGAPIIVEQVSLP